ncbi:MAG: PQQ-binding-like beta-propeller repeat protein [Odoribacter sp.]|nr:PQQ-binding-like beta-propeller repeat protein [Odoribacter sp.]
MNTLKRIILATAVTATYLTGSAQRFAILSDIHITPGNASEPWLTAAVEEINNGDYDAVMLLGDLTNEGSDVELANVKSILDNITHPLYVIPGNHELTWSQSATKTFFDLWGNDRFVFEVDSLVVVGISCGPYMKMGDGHIKQEDLHWLRSTLDERVTDGKRVLSLNHYPLQDDLDNYIEYINLLSAYPVVGHFNGHYHRWNRYDGGDIPSVMLRALDMRDGTYGYSIVDVSPEWVHVYNKNVGSAPQAKYAYAVNTTHKPVESAATAWEVPTGYEVEQVWADSASVFTRLAIDSDNVYFGNSLGHAKAVDKRNHTLQWSIPTGASLFSRPVILDKGRVAIPTATGLTLVNAATGKPYKDYPSKAGPYVADGAITPAGWVQGGYKRIEMRNAATGKIKWEYDSLFNYCQAAPAIDGDDLIFGAWDTNLRCLDLRSGKLRWVWNNGKKANMLGPGNVVPVISGERVYIVAPDRYMTAIDRATGKQLWRDNSHRYRESLGHSEDFSRIYAKTMDGELVAIDATVPDFKELWTVDMGLGYEHAPCIVAETQGVVYAGSRRGIVTAIDPAEQKVLWSLPLGVSEINGIDIDPTTGDVYVSLIEGTIFRIAKKQ